ncbi:lipopolysaccharide biosynthesis protein [Echinicola vietnamensis]|uniref:Membrane protein involved in the export of O-antigen and teichoic acid n=1 Tax=Echinicola vietnamensis (strain DSM 17526 / LMG 23754 / KMM 6221) TaxID=926556 RepID=L0G450_ECHVK|nr:polysaccharide biosynthesis C-terminal domain-containing protein [Echinicola vietnamensis]AGA80073.1 membrane protein involved in the export of O-antigen and teichoic acid [Echinicola vietnamensis DSM 17526]
MGSIRTQSSQTTIIAYAGILIGFVGSALLRPKILSEGEIGLLQLVLNTTALFASIFTLGTNLTTLKMMPEFKSSPEKQKRFITFSLLVGLIGLALAIPAFSLTKAFIFQTQDGGFAGFDYNKEFYIGILAVIGLRIFQYILDAYLRTNHQPLPGVFADSIIQKTLPILALILYYFHWIDFQQLIYFNLAIFILPVTISFIMLKRAKVFSLGKPGPFTPAEKKTIAGISSAGILELLSGGLILYIDTYMVQWLMGEDAVGIYTTLFFFGVVISVPAKAIRRVSIVTISESMAKGDYSTIQSIYKKSSQTLLVIGGLLFLGIWCNRYSVGMYLGESYAAAIPVLLFIALAQLVDCVTSVNYQIIAVSKHYYYNLFMGFLTLALLIATNYLLIPVMGVTGAAVASLISMTLINGLRYLFLRKKYHLSPFTIENLKTILIIAGVWALTDWIPNVENIYLNLIMKGLIVLVLYIPSVYLANCSPDFNVVVDKYLRKIGFRP